MQLIFTAADVRELEDEVMELRAKLQVAVTSMHSAQSSAEELKIRCDAARLELQLVATDRDFWKSEAVAWKAGYEGLLVSFDGLR